LTNSQDQDAWTLLGGNRCLTRGKGERGKKKNNVQIKKREQYPKKERKLKGKNKSKQDIKGPSPGSKRSGKRGGRDGQKKRG